jgi:sec-independent protein translocase protein TatB
MFDVAPSEFMLLAIVALVVIGPKDLPKAMRVVGQLVGKARGMARQFRSGFDTMVREAELEEMEQKWKAENERIMKEYSVLPMLDGVTQLPAADTPPSASSDAPPDTSQSDTPRAA